MSDIPSAELDRRSGSSGYLRKPFDPDVLFNLVQAHVRARS
jgi:hypothetical protein